MKLIIAGTGPGDPDMLTISALNAARNADIIMTPRSRSGVTGLAETIITSYLPDRKYVSITFPMITDSFARNNAILSQLEATRSLWHPASTVFFPTIGDAMLYSTGKYLIDAWRIIVPNIDLEFIPGISAHSLAAATAKRFLAMSDQVFAVIPGTAGIDKIRKVLASCDSAAIYKPTALAKIPNLSSLLSSFHVVRVDYAGIPERERVIEGEQALIDMHDYLSILLLWRNC